MLSIKTSLPEDRIQVRLKTVISVVQCPTKSVYSRVETWQISAGLITWQNNRLVIIVLYIGVVPEQTGQVAQDREDVGQVDHHGRVRTVRRHGTTLATTSRHHCQVGQEWNRRFLCTMVARWVHNMPIQFHIIRWIVRLHFSHEYFRVFDLYLLLVVCSRGQPQSKCNIYAPL